VNLWQKKANATSVLNELINTQMREITGNIWQPNTWKNAESGESVKIEKGNPLWVCVTTNGNIKKSDGKAVMGAGIAKEARDRYKGVDRILAQKLSSRGNRINYLCNLPEFGDKARLLSFPTKNSWREISSLDLIEASARELLAQFKRASLQYQEQGMLAPIVVVPRPGCNNGKLDWLVVKATISPILRDSEFLIICKG
jgi:hypothetical protein